MSLMFHPGVMVRCPGCQYGFLVEPDMLDKEIECLECGETNKMIELDTQGVPKHPKKRIEYRFRHLRNGIEMVRQGDTDFETLMDEVDRQRKELSEDLDQLSVDSTNDSNGGDVK